MKGMKVRFSVKEIRWWSWSRLLEKRGFGVFQKKRSRLLQKEGFRLLERRGFRLLERGGFRSLEKGGTRKKVRQLSDSC